MIYFLEIGDKIGSAIVDALRAFNLTIASLFYKLIIETFNIFIKIGSSTIIHDSKSLLPILNRISIILGIFMLFRVTFAFIEYIVNPDNMFDKNKGVMNIVKRIVIAIVLLGSTNMIFDFAYDLQDKIISEDVIPQIILGDTSSIEDNEKGDGGIIALNLFTCFFRPNEKFIDENFEILIKSDEEIDEATIRNIQYEGIKEEVRYGVFTGAKSVVNVKADAGDGEKEYLYEFDAGGLACLALGVFAFYIIFVYTMQVGVRLFQLAYLQIIAPIPIMMYITPKGDEKLKKWGQQCATTYLDFFIRTAIMYFIIFIISILADGMADGSLGIVKTGHKFTDGYIIAILILGLLLFAKKLPNLLKEIFPSLGGSAAFDYGIDFKKNVAEPFKSLYNAPVLGWGLKLGNGAIKGFDRKANGKKFFAPPKFMKKVLPETAARMEEKEKAGLDIRDRKEMFDDGQKLYSEYNQFDKFSQEDFAQGDFSKLNNFTKMFKNDEYRESFKEVQKAKALVKDKEKIKEYYDNEVAQGHITTTDENYIAAKKALKMAQGNLSEREKDHEKKKIIYKDDARREDAYNYYKNTNTREMPDVSLPPDASTVNNQSSSSNQNDSNQNNTSSSTNNSSSSTNNSSSSTNRSEQQSDPRDGLVENDYDQFGEISPEYRSEASNNNQERQDPRDGLYNNDYDENGEITQSFTPGDE